ncbi:MAG: dehydrogenase [Deltaproteobacteria bacterium RBG_13_58_19]|nr:MAG: dehydrogenase [Deltaproteobacteria bacterium RBG_13_58_19]
MNLPPETLKRLDYEMLRIRALQLRIDALYLDDEMKTPVHLCIGQEAIPVGVCAHLSREDFISSNHRGHGHYLAKGGNLKALVAELYCKETGCSKGRGGSMHLVDVAVGHYGSSSIVGGGIPIATGLGLAIKMRGQPRVSVAFFGDGAADEGVLYESINFAVLKRLPVLFVLENNRYSVCSHVSTRQKGEYVFHAMPPDLLFTAKIDGNDVLRVYEQAGAAVARARDGLGPSFLECQTYRLWGHAGCRSQEPKGYRDPEEMEQWRARCPLAVLEERLLSAGMIDRGEIEEMENKIAEELDEAFACARQDPLPARRDLPLHLFCE